MMTQERPKLCSTTKQQSLDTEYYHADSMAPKKNRQNDRQIICFLYASSIVAASLSIAVASMSYADDNGQRGLTAHWGKPLFVCSLYGTSCLILLIMAGYLEWHRDETFEAVHRGSGPVSFSVKFSLEGEKVNLYLRLGLAMFGVMSIGHVGVKLKEDLLKDANVWNYLTPVLEMAFFVLQTLFILRYHRLVILHYNEIMGAGLVHLLTTNLCIWADVSVGKIDKTLSYKTGSENNKAIMNETRGGENNSTVTQSDLMGVSFYLLPPVSEYCLLAAALIYEITVRIGQPSFIEIEKNNEKRSSNKSIQRIRACGNSNGAWFGILTVLVVIALTIVTTATPNQKNRQQNFWKSVIILTEEAILCFLGIGFVLAAFWQTRKLKFSIATRQSHAEAFLLYTAFFFGANYTISTMILAADFKEFSLNPERLLQIEQYLLVCRCLLNAFELIQILLQTYLIQDSFHRCSDTIPHQLIKPGRQSIVALLGINLAFWIQQSFQLKKADILFLNEDDKGTYGWILSVVTMPISLFYRYHCTVCLSQCFNRLYENETRRFEEIWRYRVDPITDMVIPMMGALSMYGQYDSTNDSSSPGRKISQEQPLAQTALQPSPRRRKMGAFNKTKPWKTFDIPDESSMINTSVDTSSGGQNAIDYSPFNHLSAQKIEEESSNNAHQPNEVNNIPIFKIETYGDQMCQAAFDSNKRSGSIENLSTKDNSSRLSTTPVTQSQSESPVYLRKLKSLPYRRSAKSLTLPPTSLDDLYSSSTINTRGSADKTTKSHRSSLNRTTASTQPMRRRRTLKNLETAKYRVLAAEIAHRMVIERGFNHVNRSTLPADRSGGFDAISYSKDEAVMRSKVNTFNAQQNAATISNMCRHDYNLVQAMSETAAITIAPIESRLILQPDGHKSHESTSFGHRIRQSLFPQFGRASLTPQMFYSDESGLVTDSSHYIKPLTLPSLKNKRTSSFKNLLRPSTNARTTGSFDCVHDMESSKKD